MNGKVYADEAPPPEDWRRELQRFGTKLGLPAGLAGIFAVGLCVRWICGLSFFKDSVRLSRCFRWPWQSQAVRPRGQALATGLTRWGLVSPLLSLTSSTPRYADLLTGMPIQA
jgi:hypothetical protein